MNKKIGGIRFWCVISMGIQYTFREDGTQYEIEKPIPTGEQHILYQGVLMCGKSRKSLKSKIKGKKQKTTLLRIEGLPVCKACEKKYKANSNLPYTKWVEASTQTGLHGVTVK